LTPPSSRRALLVSAVSAALVGAAAPAPKPPGEDAGRRPRRRAGQWPTQPGDMSLGNPNAPVWVVEYLSLTCPHCAHFNAEVFPGLQGQVRRHRAASTTRSANC
jgi:protein-disulfide isomerase